MPAPITAEEIESLKRLLVESHAQHADANGSHTATCKQMNCVELRSAIAWLTQRLHHRSTSRSFTARAYSVRSMLPHCCNDNAVIDSFRCSRCAWLYQIGSPQIDCVGEEDASRACRLFETHDCEDYQPRSIAGNLESSGPRRETEAAMSTD